MSCKINDLQAQVPLVAPHGVRFAVMLCRHGLFLLPPLRSDRLDGISQRVEFSFIEWPGLVWEGQSLYAVLRILRQRIPYCRKQLYGFILSSIW